MVRSEALTLLFFICHFPVHGKEDGLMKAQRKYKDQRRNIKFRQGMAGKERPNKWGIRKTYGLLQGVYSNVQIERKPLQSVFGLFLLHAHISW